MGFMGINGNLFMGTTGVMETAKGSEEQNNVTASA